MNRESCDRFDICSASLCPLENNQYYYWFPDDDEICKKQKVPGWVKIQKKVKRKVTNNTTYFTQEMLERLTKARVSKGIKGIDPDKDEKLQLEKWFKAHPEKKKRELTLEQKEGLKKGREIRKKRLESDTLTKK